MKKIIVVVIILLLVFTAGCWRDGRTANSQILGWSVVHSPLTGKCYEVAAYSEGGLFIEGGFMGMAEITQEEYEDALTKMAPGRR